jgi:soluble cytochrome b562
MRDAGSRPTGRLFYWALVLGALCAIGLGTAKAQTGPGTTTISDTVSMADGSPATGTLIITWPAFVTASGAEVAAGTTNVTLGANGALNVALVPNAGATPAGVYYSKDFQLDVLGQLAELQNLAGSTEKNWREELKTIKDQRLLRFDSRTLVALGAIALSITGYVVQDARNTARQDSEIEATKARVVRLEQIAATNTEGRIRMEEELTKLREGQAEIKTMIEAHDSATGKAR